MSRRAHVAVIALVVLGSAACASPDQVSISDEHAMGAEVAQQALTQLPLVRDSAVDQWIAAIGQELVRNADTSGRQYAFYVVDSPVANAFALPGGFVFVNREIISLAEDGSEVAGVLAHEIGHVVRRHSLRQMAKAQNANNALSLVYALLHRVPGAGEQVAIQVAGSAWLAKNSRTAETEADEVGLLYMTRAAIDPHGMPRFFEKLLREEQRQPGTVAQWFSDHPTTSARIADTNRLIDQLPQASLARTTSRLDGFAALKNRLAQLPPPPPEPAHLRAQP